MKKNDRKVSSFSIYLDFNPIKNFDKTVVIKIFSLYTDYKISELEKKTRRLT